MPDLEFDPSTHEKLPENIKITICETPEERNSKLQNFFGELPLDNHIEIFVLPKEEDLTEEVMAEDGTKEIVQRTMVFAKYGKKVAPSVVTKGTEILLHLAQEYNPQYTHIVTLNEGLIGIWDSLVNIVQEGRQIWEFKKIFAELKNFDQLRLTSAIGVGVNKLMISATQEGAKKLGITFEGITEISEDKMKKEANGFVRVVKGIEVTAKLAYTKELRLLQALELKYAGKFFLKDLTRNYLAWIKKKIEPNEIRFEMSSTDEAEG